MVAIEEDELYHVQLMDGLRSMVSPTLIVMFVGVTVNLSSDSFSGAGEGLLTGSVTGSGVQTAEFPPPDGTVICWPPEYDPVCGFGVGVGVEAGEGEVSGSSVSSMTTRGVLTVLPSSEENEIV